MVQQDLLIIRFYGSSYALLVKLLLGAAALGGTSAHRPYSEPRSPASHTDLIDPIIDKLLELINEN